MEFERGRQAIGSCLTGLFSPSNIPGRVGGMLANYRFITADALGYLTPRLDQAAMDAEFALAYLKQHARAQAQQQAVRAVPSNKCDMH